MPPKSTCSAEPLLRVTKTAFTSRRHELSVDQFQLSVSKPRTETGKLKTQNACRQTPLNSLVEIRIIGIAQPNGASGGLGARDFHRKIHQSLTEMLTVTNQAGRPRLACQQKCEKWLVCFIDVACGTGQYEVVAPVVGCLALSRSNVVECNQRRLDLSLAIRAHRSVPLEQPLTRFDIRIARGWLRRVL